MNRRPNDSKGYIRSRREETCAEPAAQKKREVRRLFPFETRLVSEDRWATLTEPDLSFLSSVRSVEKVVLF